MPEFNKKTYITPSMSAPVEVDPSAPGTLVRRAFAIEAFLNLTSLPIIFAPKQILSFMVDNPSAITPTAELLARLLGGLIVCGLTPALLLGLPNTRGAIESRRTVYLLLGGGELAFIALLVGHVMGDGGSSGKGEGGLTPLACWMSIASLAPLLFWRTFVLYVKPEMLGRYRNVKKDE